MKELQKILGDLYGVTLMHEANPLASKMCLDELDRIENKIRYSGLDMQARSSALIILYKIRRIIKDG